MQKIWVLAVGVIAFVILIIEQTGLVPEGVTTVMQSGTDLMQETIENWAVDEFEAEMDAASEESAPDELYTVVRVIDGDTIEVEQNRERATVRYIGINAPEIAHPNKAAECFGVEATEANRELVSGKSVRLERDVSNTDQYGRLLRYVYVGETLVNLALVEGGYAKATTYKPDVAEQTVLDEAEAVANQADSGLWSVACTNNAE